MDAPPLQKKHSGIFGGEKKGPSPGADVKGIVDELNNVSRRVRLLEEGGTNFRKKLQITEQNILSKNKVFSTEIKTINLEISELKREINELKDRILMLAKELSLCARKDEVKTLERYINMWNPIKFVTEQDVIDIVNRMTK